MKLCLEPSNKKNDISGYMLLEKEIKKIKEAGDRIIGAKRTLLLSHLNPDVDALSSLGALIELWEERQLDYLALADQKSDNYNFLPQTEKIIASRDDLLSIVSRRFNQGRPVGQDFLKFFDLVVILDCGSLDRTSLGPFIRSARDLKLDTFIIEIDHHVPAESYADLEIKISLASTTEILYHFFALNRIAINRNIANCLLAGLLSDTANFLYPSVSEETLSIASRLMSLGAQFPKLLNHTWRNKSLAEMKLWGLALDNLKINPKYKLAFSLISYDDLARLESRPSGDVFGDIAGFLSNLAEANLVLLLREEERGRIKGSLRVGANNSHFDLDATKLAAIFGGGGHAKAAGFMLPGHIVRSGNNFKIV